MPSDVSNNSPPPTQAASRAEIARASIAVGIALVVGTLAAVGVQGDFLPRAVRQSPVCLGSAFAAVIVGLLLPFVSPRSGRLAAVLSIGGLILVSSGVLAALWIGIDTIRERETPAVTLTIAPIPGSTTSVQVTAEALGTSLSPAESAMLRVVAVGADSAVRADEICSSSQSSPLKEEASDVDVLSWGFAGPDLTGKVTIKSSLAVSPLKYQYLCARVALRGRPEGPQSYRSAWVIVDLEAQRSVLESSSAPQRNQE